MDAGNKSIAVDHETWEILQIWASQECRTVSGQVRWLTKKNAPPYILRKIKEQPNIDQQSNVEYGDESLGEILEARMPPDPPWDPPWDSQPDKPEEIEFNPWKTSPVSPRSRRLSRKSQLFLVINAISEMNEPLTALELTNLIPELTQQQVSKRTGYAFDTGLLARKTTNTGQPGRFLFQLTKAGKRHMDNAV